MDKNIITLAARDPVRAGFLLWHPLAISLLCVVCQAQAEESFDPAFLSVLGESESVDLTPFSQSGGFAPGEYTVTLFINQQAAGSFTLDFQDNAEGLRVPLLTPALLEQLGVNIKQLPNLKNKSADQPLDNLPALIPQAKTRFDLSRLQLDISIPQVAMVSHVAGRVDPELWNEGIPALIANYNISAGHATTRSSDSNDTNTSLFASVRAGANAGAWRLRSTLTHSHYQSDISNARRQTHFSSTTLARDLIPLRSSLILGETATGADIFDGVPFKGIKLISNEQMLPGQLRGFAPAISGVANSNARVTIRQNGNIVYETYVAQGPFYINDIQQAGMSGDYNVTVTEADGTERQFIVPYSSLPVMLRPGGWKYEVSAGRYDGNLTAGSRKADFLLSTLVYGLPKNITVFGGSLISRDYQAYSLGTGISLGYFGAFSTDMTHSQAQFDASDKKTGQSWRLRYSKSLASTGTSVDLTALRYSTRDYFNFNEFNSQGYQLANGVSPWQLQRRRSSFQTQLRQQMQDWGSLYFRLNRDDYWNSERTLTGMSVGYNTTFAGVSYGINYNIDRIKDKNNNWPENRQLSASISVPFSIFGSSSHYQSTYATASTSHDNTGKTLNNMGISGSMAGGDMSYSLAQSLGNQQNASNTNANLSWQGSKGTVSGGYSYSNHYRSLNMNASGGLLAHANGILFSRSMGESVALISAPDAPGVSVNNASSITDRQGYAVAPYLSAYSKNSISLNPSTLPDNVDLVQSNINVYPTRGAVVKAEFKTRVGYQVLITLKSSQGTVPFGAMASLQASPKTEENSSIVGDGGQVYLTGLPATGMLKVKWGTEAHKQCQAPFDLSQLTITPEMAIRQITLSCLPVNTTRIKELP